MIAPTIIIEPSFHFHHPQTSTLQHEQPHPPWLHQRTDSNLGMSLDREFEQLRDVDFLVPLSPQAATLLPCFLAHIFMLMSSMYFIRCHATVLTIVFHYVIPYRILPTLV